MGRIMGRPLTYDRRRHSHLCHLDEFDVAWVGVLTNRTCATKLRGVTYFALPYLAKVASNVGVRPGAKSPYSPPGEWRPGATGRQFIHPDNVDDSVRNAPSPLLVLAKELVYRATVFYIGFFSQCAPSGKPSKFRRRTTWHFRKAWAFAPY